MASAIRRSDVTSTVGVNSSVLGAIVLGDNAKVGGGSVVVKDVPANATVVGVPARIVAQDGKPIRAVSDRPQVEMPDPTPTRSCACSASSSSSNSA